MLYYIIFFACWVILHAFLSAVFFLHFLLIFQGYYQSINQGGQNQAQRFPGPNCTAAENWNVTKFSIMTKEITFKSRLFKQCGVAN